MIITISREFGSGGRVIGREVAEALGIPFYDKEIIKRVAGELGYTLSYVEEAGEHSGTGSLLYNVGIGNMYAAGMFTDPAQSPADQICITQNRVILDIAKEGDCVIVGRSADYILREKPHVMHVFIYSDMAHKIRRGIDVYGLSAQTAEKDIKHTDKMRANHYRQYTGRNWGAPANYHLSVDSGRFGLAGSREIILAAARSI